MKKRLFILGSIKFPRGTAGANYEQYFALSLIKQGWQVIILGLGDNREQDYAQGHYRYRGIEYFNGQNAAAVRYGLGVRFYRQAVKKYHITGEDYFVVRALGWQSLLWWINRFGTRHISYIHFDDLSPAQFKMAYLNPQYWANVLGWRLRLCRLHKAFPISEALENKEKRYSCSTLRLPILADPDEYGMPVKQQKPRQLQFIYPGAKLNGCEDDINLLLDAFAALSGEEKARAVLHITGTTAEKLRGRCQNPGVLDALGGSLVIHPWLAYDELIRLYQAADFLVLARFDNPLTRANFPSKIPETLSFGIIPICTRVGDYTKYYLQDGVDSIFCRVGSAQSLVAAIRKALSMPEKQFLEMRNNARATAVERFGYQNWSKAVEDFILE